MEQYAIILCMIDKKFKPYSREQAYLLPPSLKEWLPEGHLAYFIIDIVEQLDLFPIYAAYGGDGRGAPAYEPALMTALLLYAYSVGIPSSRRIEKATHEDVAFRVLAANQHPDHDSICAFRQRHLEALSRLFLQVLSLCRKAGLVKLGHVALDGTKVKANAAIRKGMNYGKMKEAEVELERQVKELLERAEREDKEEDERYGRGKRGDDLPEELSRRESRLKKIREAKAKLEEEAREEAEESAEEKRRQLKEREEREEAEGHKMRGRKPEIPDSSEAMPEDRARYNFTDPDSRIMIDGATKGYIQGYSGQLAVDDQCQVIVAARLTQDPDDHEQLEPLVKDMADNLGRLPLRASADAGYFSAKNVRCLEEKKIDGYIAVDRKNPNRSPVVRGRPPMRMTLTERSSRKLRTKRGRQIYAKRKTTVEPVFGQTKQGRGLRQFLLRGLENVSAEWQLWCLTHNILKLYRFGSLPATG